MNYPTDILKKMYGKDAERICSELDEYAKTLTPVEIRYPNPLWYKRLNMYVIYPDGVFHRETKPLHALVPYLDHIKKLGCTAVHILPFLDSPMVDKGFDIKNYYKVRADLGTLSDIKALKKKADQLGLRVVMDLVFNHVSEEHEWFQKAVAGDEKYRNYFIYKKKKPIFIRKYHKDAAVWAEYEVKGKKVTGNIAFPEQAGEIPHWRQGKDGFWYYHTYYPQQLDVNWFNPDVFIEYGKILMYWSSLGFNFRLDAIPFIGKQEYKQSDTDFEKTFTIIAALHALAQQINPECALVVETYEKLSTVIGYFGNAKSVQSELSYNFHLCTQLWVSLVKHDVSYLWKTLDKCSEVPTHAEWINFLRNHDELSLAYLKEDLKEAVSKEILERGAPFREGYGISGRTMSLLGNSRKRFLMAYFLLFSLPGAVAIPYGDEVGKENVPFTQLNIEEQKDTRNINRGILTKNQLQSSESKKMLQDISLMLEKRSILLHYLNVSPEKIVLKKHTKEVFSARYKIGTSELVIFVNLSDTAKNVVFDTTDFHLALQVNSVTVKKETVTLGSYGGVWLQR